MAQLTIPSQSVILNIKEEACFDMSAKSTTFLADGSIVESGIDWAKTTTFPSTDTIIETLVQGNVTTTKTTTFNSDGSISEVISV